MGEPAKRASSYPKLTDEQQRAEPYGTFENDAEGGRPRSTGSYARLTDSAPADDDLVAMMRLLFCEFIGLIIFVYIGSLQAIQTGSLLNPAIAHGLTIGILIMGMGHISGGHFNPAVTLGVFLSGNMPAIRAALYVVAQLSGGFVGALLVRATALDTTYEAITGGATLPNTDYSFIQVAPLVFVRRRKGGRALQLIICETVLTYFLVHSVLTTAVDTDANVLAPLAIGLSITVDIFAGGTISGASMNPARSLGPALAYQLFGAGKDVWMCHYIYYVGPALGGALAAVVYKALLARDGKRWLLN